MTNRYYVFEASNINNYLIPHARYINRVDQLTGGGFYAKTEALYLSELSIFRRYTSQTIREVGHLPENISSLSFHPTERSFYLKNSYYGFGGISSTKAGNAFESITQKGSTHYSVAINQHYLHKFFDVNQRSLFADFLEVKRDITLCDARRPIIPKIIDEAFNHLSNHSDKKDEEIISHQVSTSIFLALSDLICASTFNNLRVNSNAFLVDKAINVINQCKGAQLSIFELAKNLHTNRRNIETAFRNHLKLSPKEYIISLRLNDIRAVLLNATRNKTSVSTVARSFGIQHLGNFSKSYYRLFGERPKETLARIPKSRAK